MEVRAPKEQYRVIGLDPVDTLTWPSGPLWKDCETFDKALDLAASNDELYLRIVTRMGFAMFFPVMRSVAHPRTYADAAAFPFRPFAVAQSEPGFTRFGCNANIFS